MALINHKLISIILWHHHVVTRVCIWPRFDTWNLFRLNSPITLYCILTQLMQLLEYTITEVEAKPSVRESKFIVHWCLFGCKGELQIVHGNRVLKYQDTFFYNIYNWILNAQIWIYQQQARNHMSNNYHLQYFKHLAPPTSKHTNLMCGKLSLQFVKLYKLDQPSSLSIAYVTVDIYVKGK